MYTGSETNGCRSNFSVIAIKAGMNTVHNNPPSKPKTIALIQARMASTRLPGKVLLPLGDKCVLQRVVDRVALAKRVDLTVVATTDQPWDDPLADACRRWGSSVFRGDESDVLKRFGDAAREYNAAWVVRVNSDNPLIDPRYIDELLDAVRGTDVDYASYRQSDGRPVMLTALSFFAEAVSRECLERGVREIVDPTEREHVTIGIYNRPSQYALRWLDVPSFCNDPRLRLTLDTQADFDLLQDIYAVLGDDASTATAEDIVRLVLEHPEWLARMTAQNTANPKTK
jgi:spore coat polysaccharide biosynthesis protein SpsF